MRSAIPIRLERRKFGVRTGTFLPEVKSLLATANLVLTARGQVPREDLRRKLPARIAIAPFDRIASAVQGGPRAIGLQVLAAAPSELPDGSERACFALNRASPSFSRLVGAAGIAIHLPPDDWAEDLEIELWAIPAEA
jgi:type VI secretion system protein ImpJ